MRMRKKKNLDVRLAECSEYLIPCKNESLNFEDAKAEKHLIDFNTVFGTEKPLVLEIGCGKGSFACRLAEQNPDINIIAVEKVANVIVSACELAKEWKLQNIRFMQTDAQYLPSYIKSGSISAIYLNFSCPYPKAKYAKHRLTHERFLSIYEELMAEGAAIYQKTDNREFFEFSLESFSQYGFRLSNISLDLHHSDFEGNIITEYEKLFSVKGFPIYRLEARLPQRKPLE